MLLDTSGLLNLLHASEPFHHQPVRLYKASRQRLTHSYVMAELKPLGQVRHLPRGVVLRFLEDLAANTAIEVAWVDRSLDAAALDLLRQHRVIEALTTARHCEQEGFERLLR